VYIKTRYQDGSQGTLLEERSWSFDARYTGDPTAYEHGGQYGTIPPGYWVDFTELASRFGWQRLPALENWRTYYPGARFNQFVIYEGLDWNMAMGEVYPPEALVTATYRPTFNPSNTFTPGNKETTSTPKPPITATPTIKPSWTLPSK
jgi:TolB protein